MVKGEKTYLFENLFPKRNTPSGIAILLLLQLQHTSLLDLVPLERETRGAEGNCCFPWACWQQNPIKEMSPSKLYCDDYYEYAYPCTPGVSYHGRGASSNPCPSCCF
ncbi:hypothetical protein NC653_020930 [Populus alba x Populus x berolinensis]|uniref:Uncharacterized protein n=1 Tax=Populus alba x Populus x berolinensis TaxID=444605 RepID=A0AAD6MLN0_9ROSI|nr:hypothetical protein NC653_020930 [Populus alba x Populus x berolinensis]